MNILYIVQYWPSLFEVYMFREVRWMKEHGHRVAVVSLGSAGPLGFRDESDRHADPAEFGVDDIPVLKLESKRISREQTVSEVAGFARREGSQLMDAHFAREPAEIACEAHLVSGIPFSVRMRGGDVHSTTSERLTRIIEHASAICPVSPFLADVLVGKRRLKKTPNGLPVDVSSGKLRVLPYNLSRAYLSGTPVEQSDDIQVVGSIGRVVPLKRFQDMIAAVSELADRFPGLRLLIIGGGPMTSDLLNLAREAGISDRFEITGFKRWDEVMTLASRLHIYIQPSEMEGFCLTAVEAGFKGIPLVLSRTGIHEECVEPGVNGYLFDSGDVTAIRTALESLLAAGARKREEMGAASLRIVGGRFSDENVMPKIESVFQAAAAGRALPVLGDMHQGAQGQ